jgi:L-asparaginase II
MQSFHDEILLEVVRGGMVESVHHGRVLIIDSDEKEVLSLGDADQLIYPRSAIKSIQASAMLRAGLKLKHEELALVCASHAGSARHLESALSILASVGLDEKALRNTPDRPLGMAERREWGDREATALAANCSGKHAGMVATSAINGWDLATYKDPSHPLQVLIRKEFEELGEEKITVVSVDGCGAPLFAISLRGMVRAIQKITHSDDFVHSEVVTACTSHPEMVSGKGRVVTESMEKVPRLLVKDGAEGVMIASRRGSGTMAWKMSDGSNRGDRPLLSASLSHLGIALEFDQVPVYGDGQVVGEIRASKLLSDVASR